MGEPRWVIGTAAGTGDGAVVILGSFIVEHPAKDDFSKWFETYAEQFRVREGNLFYGMSWDPTAPDRVWFFEGWQTQQELDDHIANPVHVEFVKRIGPDWTAHDFEWTFYTVASASEVKTVHLSD
jgi:quinol monooxygenase YgiN